MMQKPLIQRTPSGAAVMLRGTKARSPSSQRARHTRFSPRSLSFAIAAGFSGAFSAASVSISQAITGLSITLAGLASAQAQSQASNLPQGGVAVHGTANIVQNGTTLNVNTTNGANTNRSVINWQSFNIGTGHTTNINQPNAQSSSLNRVITHVPSQIHGTLRSNGQVILVNQNGIAVGAGGVVDTAGFTASTLSITDADYKAKRLRFEGNALAGSVLIEGEDRSDPNNIRPGAFVRSTNGNVMLFAPQVSIGKDAKVKADNGNVIVGAGQSVEVTGRGLEGVKFLIQSADNKAINLGTLQGNAVGVFAGTLRHSGVIQAQAATMEGGKVVLRAIKDVEIVRDPSLAHAPVIRADGGVNAQGVAQNGGSVRIESAQGNVTVGAGSQISANAGQAQNLVPNQPVAVINAAGGAIEIVATQGRVVAEAGSSISAQGSPGGTIRIFGGQESRIGSLLNVSSPSFGLVDSAGTLQLIGPGQIGGTIQVLSPGTISLTEGAQLLASGDAGGGTILVGGDYQGANTEIANAQNTNVSQGVLLEASARVNGNGGKVIVWADNTTHFSGALNAQGGERGGDGGFGETSGKKHLYFRGRADLSARRGRTGTLLLDPETLTINGGSGTSDDGNSNGANTSADEGGNVSTNYTIYESDIEALGSTANVILEASRNINFQGTFTNNDLAVSKSLTITTRNGSLDPGTGGISLGGWGNSSFTISAGENLNIKAGTAYTGTVTNAPNIFSNTGAILLLKSGSASGDVSLEAAGIIQLGKGTSLSAANGQVSIVSKLADVTLGWGGSGPVSMLTGKTVMLTTQSADALIELQNGTTITTNGAGLLIQTDRLAIDAASTLTASAGSIDIRPNTNNRLIILGGTTDSTGSGSLQISQAEFNRLNALTAIRFGNTSTYNGNIQIGGVAGFNTGSGAVALLSNGGSITQTVPLISNQLRLSAGSINLNNSTNSFYKLTANSTTGTINIASGGDLSLSTVDGQSGLSSAGAITLSDTSISSAKSLSLEFGANITAEGDVKVQLFETLTVYSGNYTIDSNTDNLGNSGKIDLGTAVIEASTTGRGLTLDTSTTSGVAGQVNMGNVVGNTLSEYMGNLTINTTAPSAPNYGAINLPASIAVSGGNLSLIGRTMLGQSSTLTTFSNGQVVLQGEVQGNQNLTINANGQANLQAEMGTGTQIANLSVTSDSVISVSNRIRSGGNISLIANSAGSINMTSVAELEGIGASASSINILGQGGVQLSKITANSNYNATVAVGTTGASITSVASTLVNFGGGISDIQLGSAGTRAEIGTSAIPIRVENVTGEVQAFGATKIYIKDTTSAGNLAIAVASVDTTLGDAVMDIKSTGGIQIFGGAGISVLGSGKSDVSFQAGGSFEALTGISGSGALSTVSITANDKLIIGGGAQISNLGYLSLAGTNTAQAIRFVDSDTVSVTGGSLNIAYGSLNQIQNSVGYVIVGKTDLSGGNISFEGASNLAPSGAKNYSFFSGGSISSTAVRNLQLDAAGFSATGNIALGNVGIQSVTASTGVTLAANSGGSIDLKVTDADGVTIGLVGGSLPSLAQINTITTAGGDAKLINTLGAIVSGSTAFDIYAFGGNITAKAYGNIGSVVNPLALHGSSFTLGNTGGVVTQTLIAAALTQNANATLSSSNISIGSYAATLTDIYLAAGVGTTTLKMDNNPGSGNAINLTASNAAGNIIVTQPNVDFSGAGSFTFDALSTEFQTITNIASGHTVHVTSGNSTIASPGGWLQGEGRLNNAGKSLLVNGTVSPGLSGAIGTLTVSGNLIMGSTGVMDLQIGTNATNGDRLVMGGNLDSNVGTLRITESALSATALGTAYTLATFVGSQGSFPTINQTTGNFNLAIDATSLTVTPISLTNKWTNTSSDSWHVASNWSRNVVPTASHDVWIDVAISNPIVTVGSAAIANSLHVGDTLTLNNSLGIAGGVSVLSGGTFNHMNGASGIVSTGGNITIDAGGVMNWAGGTIGLATDTSQQFNNNGTVNISGPGASLQNLYRNWNNNGIVAWTGGRRIDLISNASGVINLTNTATGQINLNTTLTGTDDFINGGPGNIINQGTITSASSNGATTTRLNVISNAMQNTGKIISNVGTLSVGTSGTLGNDSGSYTVASGAGLSFAGSRTLNSGASISGAGQFGVSSGTLTANSGVSLGVLTTGSVSLTGGLNLFIGNAQTIADLTLSAGSNITTGDALSIGTLNAAGGKFSGTGLVTTTGNSTITGQLERDGGNWLNTGNATFNTGGLVYLNATSTLTNDAAGSMNFLSTGSTAMYSGSGSNRFINQGTLINGAGAVSRQVSVAFDNSGVVNVNSGRLFLDSTTAGSESGTYNVATGATLQINASRNFSSLAAGAGLFGLGFLDIQGGGTQVSLSAGVGTSLLQTGTLQVGSGKLTINTGSGFTFNNTVQLVSGTISHASVMTGAINVAGNSSLTSPAGGTIWTLPSLSTSTLAMASGSTFTTTNSILENFGTVNFSGDGALSIGNSFTNQGVVNLAGNGALAGGVATFNNTSAGTVNRNTSGGTFTISSPFALGGTLSANSGTLAFTNALTNFGLLQGSARINVGGAGLTNNSAGTIAPGSVGSIATLTIAGNANLTAGNLLFDLQTPAFSDRLTVTGNVVFGSAPLKLNELTSVFVGDQISLVTFGGSATGSLPSLDTTAIGSDVTFSRSTTGSPNGALVASVDAVTTRWKNSPTNQQWTTATNWTRGHVPTAQEDVVINPTGMQTVTLSGAAGSALRVSLLGDDKLLISGQTLSLGTTSSTIAAGASLELAGGALVGATSSLNLAGNLTSTGASLIELTTFNNFGSVNVSSGTLSLNAFGLDHGTFDIGTNATLAIVGRSRLLDSNATLEGDGTLRLNGSGTLLTLSGGTNGNFLDNGTLDINAGNLLLSGFDDEVKFLKLGGNGTLTTASSADKIEVTDSLSANGGNITGPGTLTTSGNSSVTGLLYLSAGNWNNSGNLNFTAVANGDAIEVVNNSVFTNTSSGTISSNNLQQWAIFDGAGFFTGGTVFNEGLIDFATQSGQKHHLYVTQFQNSASGEIRVNGSGTLVNYETNFANAGTLTLLGGATFSSDLNKSNNITNTGLIRGNGTLNVGTGTVIQLGEMLPGDIDSNAAVGTLSVMGNLDLGDGSIQRFNMVLGGSDRIIVNGDLSFSGTSGPLMDISEFGGASFLGGELVTLMTATGTFTSGALGTTGTSDVIFRGNADTANQRYTAEVIGIQNIWNTATPVGGDWYSNSNWSRGVAPNEYHDVYLNQSSANLVTISSGAAEARTMYVSGTNNTLSISGSTTSLTVNNPDSVTDLILGIYANNTLNLSGGARLALGAGKMKIFSDGVLNLNGATLAAAASGQADATVYNYGLINNVSGTSVLGRAASFDVHLENTSTGTIHVQSGDLQIEAVHLHQHGLITLASAASSLSFSQGDLLNEGTIDLSGGILNLGSNLLTNDSAGTIRGTGTIITSELINEGTLAPGAPSSLGNLTIFGNFTNDSSGVLQIRADSANSSDQLIVNGDSYLDGTLSFSALPLSTHSFAAGNVYLPISSTGTSTGGFATVDGIGPLVATGLIQPFNGYQVSLSNPSGSISWIVGDGDWDDTANWNLGRLPQAGDLVIINPSGTHTITVDSATALSNLNLSATGSDDTLMIVSGGQLTLQGGDILKGTLHVSGGTLTNAGSNTGTNAANDIFMSSGQINVGAALEVKTLTFQGGTLNISSGNTLSLTTNGNWNGPAPIIGGGNFYIANTGVLTISGSDQRVITGTNIINDGSLRMVMASGSDKLVLASGSVLTNYSIVSASGGGGVTQVISGDGTLNNQGGTLSVDSNEILNIRTGSLNINGGAVDAGAGLIQLEPTIASYTGKLTLVGGLTQISEGAHTFNDLTLSGGSGTLRIDGTGSPSVVYNDVKLDNYPQLQIYGGTNTIPSGKTLDIASGYVEITSNIAGTGHINNEYYLSITNANITPSVNNNNTLDIYQTVNLSSLTQSSGGGYLQLNNDATLIHGAGSLLNPLGAAISGNGTINVGAGTLTNQGLIQVGGYQQVGALKVVGNANLSSGTIEFDLNSTSSYDKFSAIGNITLPSAVKLIELAPFIGSGDSFTLIQSSGGNVAGSAPALSLVDTSNNAVTGVSFSKALSATSFSISTDVITNAWVNTGSGDWSVAANWSRGHIPRAAEDVFINAPSTNSVVSITTPGMTARSLIFAPASDESLAFNSGTLSIGSGGISTNVGNTLFMSSGKLSSAGVMNFDGPMQLSGGQIDIGSTLNSTGLISLNGTMIGAGTGNWNSSGTLAGAGSLGLGAGTFLNTGTISPGGAGSIAMLSIAGHADFTSGTVDIDLQNTSNHDKLAIAGNLNSGGTIRINQIGTVAIGGGDAFTAVSFGGNLTGTTPSIISNISGKSFAASVGGTFNNAFTLTAGSLSDIFWDGGGNDGLWSNALNWSTDLLPVSGQRVTLNPAGSGSVTIATGTGITGLGGLFLDSTDALFITGGALALPGSNLALNGTVNLQSGTLTGNAAGGAFNILNWSGGSFNGSGNYSAATLNLAGGGSRALSGVSLFAGASSLGAGTLALQTGARLDTGSNALNVANGANLAFNGGQYTSTPGLINDGLVQVNSGFVSLPAAQTHTGQFAIASGATLLLSSSASSFDMALGSDITGLGMLQVAGNTNINGNFNLAGTGSLVLSGGILSLNTPAATLNFANPVTIQGGSLSGSDTLRMSSLNWRGGQITAGTTLLTPSGALSTIDGTNFATLGGIWNNQGIIQIDTSNGSGYLTLAPASTLNNQSGGLINVASNGGITNLFTGNATLNNQGVINWNTSQSSMSNTAFNNLSGGQLNLQGGSDLAISPSFTQSGTLNVSAGSVLTHSNGFTNTGLIQGAGTINVGTGTLTNAATGTIAPGGAGSIAMLSIAGHADFTSGTVDIDLQNTSNHDKLAITGNLNSGGTIRINQIGTVAIGGGDAFTAVSFGGNLTGGNPSLVSNISGKSFTINTSGTSNSFFTLTAITLAPLGSIFWDGDANDGLWSTASNWSTDLLPASGQRVTINPAGNGSITIASGTNISGLFGLNLDATDALFITGGSLALPGTNLALSGTVNLQGGTLVGNSAGGTIGQLNWASGTIAGSGSYLANTFAFTTLPSGTNSRVLSMASGSSLNANAFTTTMSGGSLSLVSGTFGAGLGMVVGAGSTLGFDGGSLGALSFNNQGTTQINTGNVVLPVTATQTGVFNIANTASLEFSKDTTLAAGASVAGGAWAIANGKTVTSAGSLNRGSGGVTFVNGTLTVGSGFETDQLIMLSGGSLASSGSGVLKVNTQFNDLAATHPITGFGSATLTQQSGNLAFHQDLSVTGAMSLTSSTGEMLSNGGTLSGGNLFAVAASHIELDVVNTATIGASSTGGNITLDISGPTVLNALSTSAGRFASVTSDSNIGHVASINTLGRIQLDVGSNNVSWTNFSNSIAQGVHVVSANQVQLISNAATPLTFSGTANSVQLGGGAIQLGSSTSTLNVSGPLTVVASGNITQGALLNISGITDLSSSNGDILLPIASSYSGNVLLDAIGTGGTATINSNRLGGINFGTSAVNTLNLTAIGPVTQSAPIEVAGLATVNAPGQVVNWLQTANDIGSLQINASTLQLADTNGLSVGGSVTVNSAINFGGALSTRVAGFTTPVLNLAARATGSSVNMDVNVSGASSFTAAGGDYSTVSYRNANTGVAALSSITATGSVGLSHGGALPLPSIQAASLSVTAAGPVTQSGTALQIAGNANVTASAQNITLTKAGNSIGNFSATGGNIALVSNQTVNPDIDATGSVSITAPNINQSVGNAINSAAFSASTPGGLGLFGNNQLGSVSATAGADINIRDVGASLVLGNLTAAGANGISINATDAVTAQVGTSLATSHSAAAIALTGTSVGGSAGLIQVDTKNVRFLATNGDAYVRNINSQAHELTSAQAKGTLHYETVTGDGYAVTGNVSAANVELLSGGNLNIGNANTPVAINGGNSVLLSGANISLAGGSKAGASSSVFSKGIMNVNATGNLVIQGGSANGTFASIDVLGAAKAVVTGTLSVIGGTGVGAYAKLDPAVGSPLDVIAGSVNLQGGAGAGAYAAIISDGNITISANSLNMLAGSGSNADAVIISNFGSISVPGNCNGCVNLAASPLGDGVANAGLFAPDRVPSPPPVNNDAQITQSLLLTSQLTQIETSLDTAAADPDEDKRKQQEIVVEGQTCP